jgi:hypothetical protein
LCFVSVAPWIRNRLYATLQEAAGYPPLLTDYEGRTILVLGDSVKNHSMILSSPWRASSTPDVTKTKMLTDDWPYLYVDPNVTDYPYLLVVVEVLLLAAFAGRRLLFGKGNFGNWTMFFLGSAFMLLEFQAISFLSLLYGSTWLTAALVINCILIMLLVSNFVAMKYTAGISEHSNIVFAILFLALIASYFLPANMEFFNLRHSQFAVFLLTLVTLLPLGVAGIIFASSFSQSKNASSSLAFNLFGAVVGALLEYLSNFFGIRALVMFAGLLYGMAFVCVFLSKRRQDIGGHAPEHS